MRKDPLADVLLIAAGEEHPHYEHIPSMNRSHEREREQNEDLLADQSGGPNQQRARRLSRHARCSLRRGGVPAAKRARNILEYKFRQHRAAQGELGVQVRQLQEQGQAHQRGQQGLILRLPRLRDQAEHPGGRPHDQARLLRRRVGYVQGDQP